MHSIRLFQQFENGKPIPFYTEPKMNVLSMSCIFQCLCKKIKTTEESVHIKSFSYKKGLKWFRQNKLCISSERQMTVALIRTFNKFFKFTNKLNFEYWLNMLELFYIRTSKRIRIGNTNEFMRNWTIFHFIQNFPCYFFIIIQNSFNFPNDNSNILQTFIILLFIISYHQYYVLLRNRDSRSIIKKNGG